MSRRADREPMTLVKFLTARLDEDEAQVNGVIDRASLWRGDVSWRWLRVTGNGSTMFERTTHDPERVLREVAAKREILQRRADIDRMASSAAVQFDHDHFVSSRDQLDEVIALLAAVYSDHPDYRAEWAVAS